MTMVRRSLLITSSMLLAAPCSTFSQTSSKVWRIGFLAVRAVPPSPSPDPFYMAFLQDLRELGYAEGKNLEMVWRSSDGKNERLPQLAAELARMKLDLIVAIASTPLRAAQQATGTIPIVFVAVGDPVALGFVASLAKPGKNITGVSIQSTDLSIKSLEFLGAVVPKLSRVAVLLNPTNPTARPVLNQIQLAAGPANISISAFEAESESQIDAAFTAFARTRPDALIVGPDPFFTGRARLIAELAARNRLPAIYSFNPHPEAGGLMSYGENLTANFRRGASYVDKVLKGAKPANLPVEQPTRLELVLNMKTARALGLTIPQSMLLRVDRVIE